MTRVEFQIDSPIASGPPEKLLNPKYVGLSMRYAVSLVFIIVCIAVRSLSAQVLVCAPGDLDAAKACKSTLAQYYTGTIDVSDNITTAVNNYKVVFILIEFHSLVDAEALILQNYVKAHKNLYIEFSFRSYDYAQRGSTAFWDFIGIPAHNILVASQDHLGVDRIRGVNGTIGEGIDLTVENPVFLDTTLSITGLPPILFTSGSRNMSIAFARDTSTMKIMFHLPVVRDHYNNFIGRVACNYFGLCTPLILDVPTEKPNETNLPFQIYPNPTYGTVHITGTTEPLHSIELLSLTGSVISRKNLSGSFSADLDLSSLHISSGDYLLRLTTPEKTYLQEIFYTK
jgi:hypothetical protein